MTHSSVAKRERERKERDPQWFCSSKGCLWRRPGTAPKHGEWLCPKHRPAGRP